MRSLPEIKKKWSDIKVDVKNRVAAHRRSVSATGGGPGLPALTPHEERVAAMIGETTLVGILPENEAESDMIVQVETGECSARDAEESSSSSSVSTLDL
ncbi:nuclear apoptosis-inducing factor 1-like [Austrofundulus limnaeus]|uniref:Nuclear apoptosis-inducing factor 1-like n=1 Tax=Austrofundulus limnaeus TaxID=52670 RepID=A0A2I4C6K2_AUSLI|nr:PREDICTED: nuclear apoptosis-inducing factor 1-like [Austrofundulus limnaeus]